MKAQCIRQLLATAALLAAIPGIQADDWVTGASGLHSRHYAAPNGDAKPLALEPPPAANLNLPAPPRSVSIFYPPVGTLPVGACWLGLTIDRHDNLYPTSPAGVYKILPNGTLVNGVNDKNLFAYGGASDWAVLDERNQSFYKAALADFYVAPFKPGSHFARRGSGLNSAAAVALGRGRLARTVITTAPSGLQIIRPYPYKTRIFTSGAEFSFPSSLASAPDGSIYSTNLDTASGAGWLTKTSPYGESRIFAFGADAQVSQAVITDDAGNVYWSQTDGIDKYDANGNLTETLPGPPDKPKFGSPMGSVFDSRGNLYVLDNFDWRNGQNLCIWRLIRRRFSRRLPVLHP